MKWKIEDIQIKCLRVGCGYKWLPRKDKKIRVCPKCKFIFLDEDEEDETNKTGKEEIPNV